MKNALSILLALMLVISMGVAGCEGVGNGNGNDLQDDYIVPGDDPSDWELELPPWDPLSPRWVPLQGVYEGGFFWTGLPAVTPEPHIFTLVHLPLTQWDYDTDEEVSEPEVSEPVVLEELPNDSGVVIGLPQAALDQRIEITISKVEDDPREEVPFPDSMKDEEGIDVLVVGDFYSIASHQTFMAGSPDFAEPVPADYEDPLDDQDYMEYLVLGFPVPEDTPTDDLWVAVLVPTEWIDYCGPSDTVASEARVSVQEVYDGDESNDFAGSLLSASQEEPQCCSPDHGHLADAVRGDDAVWPSFIVLGYDFDVVSTGFIAAESPAAHRTLTRTALRAAREAYRGKGFPEPRLRLRLHSITRDIQPWPPRVTVTYHYRYEYLLERGDSLDGYYNRSTRAAATIYTGHPQEPPAFIAHHELFHAVQCAYSRVRRNWHREVRRTMEAAATAAEMSLSGLTRSNQTVVNGRYPYPVTHPLWSSPTVSSADYAAQDFMVYIGRRLDKDLSWMIPWFRAGGREVDLDSILQDTLLGSLGNAYWGFVKSQAYEKHHNLGVPPAQVPHGAQCSWSGHGRVCIATYDTAAGTWQHCWPWPWPWFALPRLHSVVLELEFPSTGAEYEVKVGIQTSDADVRWKFYLQGDEGGDDCWIRWDNTPQFRFQVPADGLTAWLLVSNTNRVSTSDFISLTKGS